MKRIPYILLVCLDMDEWLSYPDMAEWLSYPDMAEWLSYLDMAEWLSYPDIIIIIINALLFGW